MDWNVEFASFQFIDSGISNNLPKTKILSRLKSRNGQYYINQIVSHSSEYPLAENVDMRHEWNWFVLGNKFLADFGCAICGCARHKGNDVLVFLGPAFSFTHAVVATRIFDIMWKPKKHWCCIKIVSNIEKTVECINTRIKRQTGDLFQFR